MSRVIAGDYGGMFGLESLGRVFRDWAGQRWWWWGLLVVLFRSSEDFFFSFFYRDPNIRKRKSGVLHSSVIFQTSNNKVFQTILPSVMSERGLVLTPAGPRNQSQQTNGGGMKSGKKTRGFPNHSQAMAKKSPWGFRSPHAAGNKPKTTCYCNQRSALMSV